MKYFLIADVPYYLDRSLLRKASMSWEEYKKVAESLNKEANDDEDPCWEGYEQVGMKTKRGKKVPNCVPKGE